MFGFIFGTVCLVALAKLARGGRCGHHGGGCGHCGHHGGGHGHCGHHGGGWGHGRWGGGPWGHEHGHDHDDRGEGGEHGGGFGGGFGGGRWGGPFGGGGFERVMLRRLFQRIDATPGQEKVIAQAFDEVRGAMRDAWGKARESREDLARAMAAESFDENSLGNAFAKQDEAMTEARKAVAGAMMKVHEALNPQQRQVVSEMLSKQARWGRGGMPYRM